MSIIKNILFVGAGSFLGGALRYLVSHVKQAHETVFFQYFDGAVITSKK